MVLNRSAYKPFPGALRKFGPIFINVNVRKKDRMKETVSEDVKKKMMTEEEENTAEERTNMHVS